VFLFELGAVSVRYHSPYGELDPILVFDFFLSAWGRLRLHRFAGTCEATDRREAKKQHRDSGDANSEMRGNTHKIAINI
jgi:hypothetical protein